MRITVELPKWCEGRHLYIMGGIELAAYNLYNERVWYVKTERCSSCGECCRTAARYYFGKKEDGSCIHLASSNDCGLGIMRPHACSVSVNRKGGAANPNCTIEYRRG